MNSRLYLNSRQQHGAALIVALLLLLVLTLLAVAGMNSAGLELLMAGNEQFRQNAFQASETGVAVAYENGKFDGTVEGPTTTTLGDGSTYTTTITPQLGGKAIPAFSWKKANNVNKFKMMHFEIESAGTSTRGASTDLVQGVGVLVINGDDVGADPGSGNTQFN